MFFIKEYLGNQSELITYITEDNVFCTCPNCGADVQVSLNEAAKFADGNIHELSVYCDACAKTWYENKSQVGE